MNHLFIYDNKVYCRTYKQMARLLWMTSQKKFCSLNYLNVRYIYLRVSMFTETICNLLIILTTFFDKSRTFRPTGERLANFNYLLSCFCGQQWQQCNSNFKFHFVWEIVRCIKGLRIMASTIFTGCLKKRKHMKLTKEHCCESFTC